MCKHRNTTDDELGAELLRVIARLNRWATRHAGWTLPVAQVRLLAEIDELGPARIGALARFDHCSQPAMTTQIRRLEASDLVYRLPDPSDGRASLIDLTERGRGRLREIRAARSAAIAPLIDSFDAAERRRLHGALEALSGLLTVESTDSNGSDSREKP